MGSHAQVNGVHRPLVPLHNDISKPWTVQKFGGTSIGKFAVRIAEKIVCLDLQKSRLAVVCSARSGKTKLEGTTSRLLRAAQEAANDDLRAYEDLVSCIEEDHIQAAKNYIVDDVIVQDYFREVRQECRELRLDLAAAQRIGESPGFADRIISRGEILSSRYIQALLKDRGVASKVVDLSEIIKFKVPQGLDQGFYQQLAGIFAQEVLACGEQVPVITGYFGPVPGGLLNKIGRGYTDLCAALVAVGLGAHELQIWKEVEGVFTADPRKVPTATWLPKISPAEAAELTFYGSEVIHPFTMEQVIRASIPIRIKNVGNPSGPGTLISPDVSNGPCQSTPGHDPKLFRIRSSSILKDTKPKRPTAVTIKNNIVVMNVHSNKQSAVISAGGGGKDKDIVHVQLRKAIEELQRYGTVDIIGSMAILSLVGKQMKNMTGIAGKMFSTLGENNINIEMISQGASEINISCVIEERDADRALNILHTNLFTFLD